MAHLTALPAGKSVDPTEIARAIAGQDEKAWRLLMASIRRVAIRLAKRGDATILRKGKPVDDIDAFKGVYRIGPKTDAAPQDAAAPSPEEPSGP